MKHRGVTQMYAAPHARTFAHAPACTLEHAYMCLCAHARACVCVFVQDLLLELQRVRDANMSSDFDFHSRLTAIFSKLNDAHTVYTRPSCYAGAVVMPIGLLAGMEGSRLVVRAGSLSYAGMQLSTWPGALQGSEITAIDGVSTLHALSAFAEDEEVLGSDTSSRMSALLLYHRFSSRALSTFALPSRDNMTLTLRHDNGSVIPLTLPWLAFPEHFDVNSTAMFLERCNPPPRNESSAQPTCPHTSARRLLERDTDRHAAKVRMAEAETAGDADTAASLRRVLSLSNDDLARRVQLMSLHASVPRAVLNAAALPALRRASMAKSAAASQPAHMEVHTIDRQPGTRFAVDLQSVSDAFGAGARLPPAAANVEVISERVTELGMYLLFHPQANTYILRISTFHPPGVDACTAALYVSRSASGRTHARARSRVLTNAHSSLMRVHAHPPTR